MTKPRQSPANTIHYIGIELVVNQSGNIVELGGIVGSQILHV